MKSVLRAILCATALVVMVGCAARFESFSFVSSDGSSVDIWQSRRVARDAENRFQPSASTSSTPVYHLAKTQVVGADGQSFAFSYTNTVPHAILTLYADKNTVLAKGTLPAVGETKVRFLFPLERGARLWGYQVSTASDTTGALTFTSAGFGPSVHGFSIDKDTLSTDGSVEVLSASPGTLSARITSATREQMANGIWVLSIGMGEGAAGGRFIFTDPAGKSATFDVNPASTPRRLDFARGSMEFLPQELKMAGIVQSVRIAGISADAPIPADPGAILSWDRAQWRKPDFELFSWTRFPKVLIFDFSTYDLQDAFLKRVAFFVEKAGHAGSVEPLSSLNGKHAYNAHDYRAEDLARFFQAALQHGGISTEEGVLAKNLVNNGLLLQTSSGYAPGEGSILSISRESSPALRDLLLTHECFHGVFFSLPAFRDAAEKQWASLSNVERAVWLDYLGAHGYDTTDHFLMVNEFQSYLFQQERIGIWGFQDKTLAAMRGESGRSAGLVRQLLASHASSFLKSFDALDSALQAAGGPPGGHAIAVNRVTP